MGIERRTAEFLAWCRGAGVDFSTTLTLGRQDFNVIGRDLDRIGLPGWLARERQADALFRELGTNHLDSLDASGFEGATITHDLSDPFPEELQGRFSAVFDGGTLEHVFDVPAALASALTAVAPGGHFITVGPVNNDAGHGMYQFSPEFWYRALGASSGFQVVRVLLREMKGSRGQWWDVRDPAQVGTRAMFTTKHAAQLFVLARRVGGPPAGRLRAVQSDYAVAWEASAAPRFATGRRTIGDLLRRGPVERRLDRLGLRLRPAWFTRPRYQRLPEHFISAGALLTEVSSR